MTSVTLIVDQIHAASFRPTQPIFVANRTCFDVKDRRDAVSVARYRLRDDDDLVAYAAIGIATALGGNNRGGAKEIKSDVVRLFNRGDMHLCTHSIRYFLQTMHNCPGHKSPDVARLTTSASSNTLGAG